MSLHTGRSTRVRFTRGLWCVVFFLILTCAQYEWFYGHFQRYVAGVAECGELPKSVGPSDRDSEPWRTYAEALYSGAIDDNVTAELLAWHQTQQGGGVAGSRLKLGILSGCGGDVHCGDQFETYVNGERAGNSCGW